VPRLRCVIVIIICLDKAAKITHTRKEEVSIDQLNHNVPEKCHATDELVG